MDNVVNFAALRAEAFSRLRKGVMSSWSPTDKRYIGLLLYRSAKQDVLNDGIDDPMMAVRCAQEHWLVRLAEEEIDVLGIGKWMWLTNWLSPRHEASTSFPEAMAEIALYLLGMAKIPEELIEELGGNRPRR
jgi:hypothetical protein